MKKIMIKNPVLVRFGMILVLALAISSIVSSFFLGSRMRQENVEMMEKTISVVEYTLDTDKPLQEQLQKVHASALDANVRVTIIAKDGTVLADSDLKNVDGMENHLDRQEVKEALEKGEGSSTRYSESLGQEMLYVAKLSEDGKAIVRMSIPYTGLFRYMIVVLPLLLVGMIVAFAVSVAVAARYSGYIRSDEIKRQMVSRLESKDAEVTLSKVNLKSVMDEVLESLTPQAASCKVEISGSCGNVILQASLQQMRELLSNLISNGIKYNHPGGHVWTKIWQEPEAVYIEVKDDGVGIDPEDQKRVFERFFRVDKGRSRKMGGTGLGLSIVKHITAYYGGSVRLTSEPGAGSTFFVEIPMSGINKM